MGPQSGLALLSVSVSVTTPLLISRSTTQTDLHRKRYLAHIIRKFHVWQNAGAKPCHWGSLAVPSACLAVWPWPLPAHTVPHITSPSLVSSTNQRTLIRGWEVDASQTKTTPAHHSTLVWKCTAWARDNMMKRLALEMFESIVIPLYQSDFMLKDWIS